jgi:hypothetical protein
MHIGIAHKGWYVVRCRDQTCRTKKIKTDKRRLQPTLTLVQISNLNTVIK